MPERDVHTPELTIQISITHKQRAGVSKGKQPDHIKHNQKYELK